MDNTNIFYIVVLVILFFLSMFYSSSDMTYSIVDKIRLQKDLNKNSRFHTKLALTYAEKYDETISTILFCNNLVNIGISSFTATLAINLWGADSANPVDNIELYTVIVVTFIVFLFGEIIPKSVSRYYSYNLSKMYSVPIMVSKIIFFPIVWPVTNISRLIIRPFKERFEDSNEPLGEEELQEMVDAIEEDGIIDEKQGELLRSALTFTETQAYEIMTPRVDILAFDITDDIDVLFSNSELLTHSRIPVYENTTDNIIGIILTNELLKKKIAGEVINIHEMIQPVQFIPRSMNISDLLTSFKESSTNLVIVKDEYGGTDGLITIEDVVEELVGDIFDETDDIEEEVRTIDEKTKVIMGTYNIEDFFDLYDYYDDEDTDYTTVAGWCVEKLGKFAAIDDVFETSKFTVKIVKVDDTVVEEVIVTLIETEDE